MARRRYQHGCVCKRGKNWVVRFREDVIQPDGTRGRVERTVILLSAKEPKKKAKQAAEKFLAPTNSGKLTPHTTMSFEGFWFAHFEPTILPKLKTSTQMFYRTLATKHLLPVFGCHKMVEISRATVQQFIAGKQRQGYAGKTLAHLRNLLSKVFSTAVRWDWLNSNPAEGIELPSIVRMRVPRVLSPREIARLAEALAEPTRTIFLLGILLGLRIGELLALKVQDVDLLGGWLYIRRNCYRGVVNDTPKTPDSERRLPLPGPIVSLIAAHCMGKEPDAWLFPSTAGTPFDDRNLIRREVEPVCNRLGLPGFTWHSLRHTFSTYGGNSGMAMPVLQSLLGHTTPEMTMRYTHPLEHVQREAVDSLAKILWPNVAETEKRPQETNASIN